MSPTIRNGEYLIVAPVDAAQVDIGDIVLCQMRRGPIAHRVCAIASQTDDARQFTLYGDASLDSDLPVAAQQLRGQVVGVERDGKRLSLKILGGFVGRAVFMIALGLRRSILIARARLGALLIPAHTAG